VQSGQVKQLAAVVVGALVVVVGFGVVVVGASVVVVGLDVVVGPSGVEVQIPGGAEYS